MKTEYLLIIGLTGLLTMLGLFITESKAIVEQPILFFALCGVTGICSGLGISKVSKGI